PGWRCSTATGPGCSSSPTSRTPGPAPARPATPARCSRSRPAIRAAGGRLRTSTRSAADESEPDLIASTRRTRASQARLLAAVACLVTACWRTAPRSGGAGARATGPRGARVPRPPPPGALARPGRGAPARPRPPPRARPPPTSSATPRASRQPSAAPLAGITVGIDPGHNGLNGTDPSFINHLIWNGRESETCDTTGTQTASGYTEARFNFDVARDLRAALIADG